MASESQSNIIRACFAAFKSKDRKIVEELLTDDFRFTSPMTTKLIRLTYFERCWLNNEHIRTRIVERIFEQGNEAFVTYKCILNDGKEFRNTEFFTFDGDKIRHIDVYFGAAYKHGAFVKVQ